MAGLRKKRRTTKQALLRRAVIKAGRNADDTVDRSALYDVPQTRSSPQAKAITVLPSFNKDAQLVHIMQRSLSNNSGSSWEPRGAHRITRIKPNKTEAKLQHIFLETPFRSAEQRKEADNGAAKKSGLKKPNTNDNRSGVSLKAFEPSKGSKGSRASSLGYPSSWNLEVPGEDEVSAVVANELSLSEIVNCELLNRTIYDNRLNAPVTLRRPTKIDNAVQCVLPQMPKTATLRRKKTAGVQTQTITKRRLLTPKPMQYKIPRLQRIRSRMFPIGTRRSISPTGIIRMDRLLGVTAKGMRPRVYSGKADIHTESVPNNVGKNSRNPKNLRRPASPGSSNDEERGMKKLDVAKDPNYGGYTPSDCSCESKSNDSLDKQNKLTAAPKESSEHYNRIDKISQPPNGKERKHQKPESSSAECKCNGQPGNQLKTHQATCTKVKCPNKSWDSRMANEQEIKEAGNKSGTSGTSSTMHYCYCSQKKSSAKNVVFESQGSNDTEQTQNSSSEQRFAKPASDTKLPKAPGQTCQCPKCSNAVTQTPKRGKNERIATKSKVHSENSSEECICICANCIAKGMGTAQNSKGTSDVCDCKCPTCTKAKSKSQPTNAVREMEGKALSSDRSAKQSSRESRAQKPGRGTMHSPREGKPSGPERRMTLSSREPRIQSPVPGVYPQGTVARPKGRQETVKQLKCQCPKAKVIQALHEFNEYCIYKCPNCSNRVQQPNINAAMYAREGMYGMSPCQCPGCRMLRRPGSPMSSSSHPRSGRDSPTRNPMSDSRRHNYNGKRHHEPKKSSSNSNDSSNESIERILPVVTMSSNQDKVNKKVQCDCKCPNCGININDFSRDDRKKSEIDLNPNKLYSQTQPRPDTVAREARNAQEMGANLYGSNRYEANNQDVQEDADRECQICNTIMAKKKYAMASKTKYDVESDNKYDMDPEQKYDMESDDKYDMDREQNYDIDPKQKYDIDRERKYDIDRERKYDIDRERKYDIDRERKYDIDREHKYDMDRDTEAKSKYDANPNRHRRPHCNLETCNKKCNKCKITAAKTKTGDAMVNLVVDDKCNVNQIIQILQETVLQLEGQKKLLSQSVENAVVTQNDNINNVQKNYANGTLTSLNPNLMPEPYCDIRNCPVYKSQSPDQEQLYKATAYTTCPGYNPFQQRKGSPLEGSPQATRRNRNPAVYQDPSSLQYQPTDEFQPHHDRFIAMDPNAPHQGGLRSRSGSTYPLKENSKISSLPREILQKIKPTKSFIDMFHMALALKGNKGYYHNPNAHANFYGQSPKEQEFLDYAQYASNILAAAKRKQVPGKQLARDQSTRDLRFYLHNAPSVEHSSKNSPGHNSPKYPTSKYLKQNFKFSSHTGIGDRSNSPPRLQGQSEQEQRHRRPDRAESHFFRKDNNESTAKSQIAEQHNREDLVRRQPIVCSGIHDKSKNPYFRRELAQRDLFQKHEHRDTGSEYTELRDKSPCQPQVPNIIKENPFLQKRESTGIVPPCEFRTRQIQDMYSCGLEFCRKCPKTSKVLIHRKRCSDKEFKYCSEFCCMEKPNRRDLQKIQPALSIYGHSKSQSSFGSGRARHRRKMGTPTKRKISYLKLEDFSSKHLESKHSQSSVVNAFRKKLQDLKENSLQNKNSNLSQKYTPIYKVDLLGNTLDPSKSLPSKSRCLYSCKSSEIQNKKLTADLKAKKSKSNQSYSQEPNAEKKVKEGPDLSEAQKSEMKGIVYLGRRKTGDNQETEGSDSEFKKFEARKSQYTAKGRAESDFSDHSASKRIKSKTNITPTRRRAGEKKESEESLFLASKNQSRSTELLARRRAGEKADSDESDHFERNQSVSSIGKRRTSEKRAKEISHSDESKNSNSISFGVYSYLNKTKKGRKVSVELPAITLANDAQLESTNRTKLQGVLALGNRTKKERKPVLITPEKQVKKVVSASSGFASFKHRKSRRNSHKEQSDCDDVKVLYDSSYKFSKHSYGDGDSNDECETDFKRQALFKAQPSSSQNNFFCMLKARDKFMGCHKYSN
ncbi:uncharacterized protein [Drosophila virilis]|uniref:Uncharacterized protein n=1 Tax=Drosophila virilis TaxID=7244 RepID=B4LTC9_DROVI|nr:uncharacterized protein LOC6627727 [Drosophila virilis]EDW63899.1 uncharacterized protein Dvir_GJ17160 [Drosophila virilis]